MSQCIINNEVSVRNDQYPLGGSECKHMLWYIGLSGNGMLVEANCVCKLVYALVGVPSTETHISALVV